ncbi:hypothetical protein PbDSM24746_32000 [Paenibacillus macerans]|nr:hypothetical protein PbDSM24746_32000 [Paenibacillus macerans]GBK69509.1 hypothetical protein PbJCM17693_32170 [Paenibacillus macerans]GIP08063.1 hypothetical protein J1TS5_02330 [Paenibacillus macerans]
MVGAERRKESLVDDFGNNVGKISLLKISGDNIKEKKGAISAISPLLREIEEFYGAILTI